MVNALMLSQIVRNGKDLSNAASFDNMSIKEARILLNKIPGIKADRQWKAFKIKARRKIVNMLRF